MERQALKLSYGGYRNNPEGTRTLFFKLGEVTYEYDLDKVNTAKVERIATVSLLKAWNMAQKACLAERKRDPRKTAIREILHIARRLLAEPEPYGLSEKGRQELDHLRAGVEAKQIYNVVFEEIKHRLQRNLEQVFGYANSNGLAGKALYCADAYISGFNELPKAIRMLEKTTKSVDRPTFVFSVQQADMEQITAEWTSIRAELLQHIENMKTWLPVKALLEEAKPLIIKGRVPTGLPPKTYTPPPVSDATIHKLIADTLEEVVSESKASVVAFLTKHYLSIAEQWQEDPELASARKTYRWLDSMGMTSLRSILFTELSSAEQTIQLQPDYEARVARLSQRETDDMAARYVVKNTGKLASLIAAKGKPSSIKASGVLANWGFQGVIRFEFDDGTGFTVHNSAVMKWTMGGQPFYQFPTTFHNVKFTDGKTRGIVSEEEMNEVWVKS